MFFMLTQYLQMVRGYSPLAAAVRTLPFSAAIMVVAPSSAGLAARLGTRAVVTTGLATAGTGMAIMSLLDLDSPYWLLALSFVVLASGMGLTMAPATASIMTSLPQAKAGVGSAMNDTTRELGGALGVAVLGSVLASTYAASIEPALRQLPDGVAERVQHSLADALRLAPELGPAAGEVLGAARAAFVDGMSRGLLLAAIVAFAGAIAVRLYLPQRTVLDDASERAEHAGHH